MRHQEFQELRRLRDAERFALGIDAGRARAHAQERFNSMRSKMEMEPSHFDPDHDDTLLTHPKLDAMIDSRLVKMNAGAPQPQLPNSMRDHWRKSKIIQHQHHEQFLSLLFTPDASGIDSYRSHTPEQKLDPGSRSPSKESEDVHIRLSAFKDSEHFEDSTGNRCSQSYFTAFELSSWIDGFG
eukprot:TRINITY_DN620_c0_g1_i1.p1 TRINITY_DN620_c0_g1~~TRINITY_DN620_c0_g1_i1.p1  ORF type:complete len:215 (-),score=18.25 TRINITY_DN620_c0_g1_i1:179-727(-)